MTPLPGKTSSPLTPSGTPIHASRARFTVATATCRSASAANAPTVTSGRSSGLADASVTLPRDSAAVRATAMEATALPDGAARRGDEVRRYSTSGQSAGKAERAARVRRGRAERAELGSFSKPGGGGKRGLVKGVIWVG